MSPHNVVRRKSIRCGDPGNGKIRVDFAWGVENVNFLRYFEGGGHKKGGFFKLIYSASRGIRVLAPIGGGFESCARPHFLHARRRASAKPPFFRPKTLFSLKKSAPPLALACVPASRRPRASCLSAVALAKVDACGVVAESAGALPARPLGRAYTSPDSYISARFATGGSSRMRNRVTVARVPPSV